MSDEKSAMKKALGFIEAEIFELEKGIARYVRLREAADERGDAQLKEELTKKNAPLGEGAFREEESPHLVSQENTWR